MLPTILLEDSIFSPSNFEKNKSICANFFIFGVITRPPGIGFSYSMLFSALCHSILPQFKSRSLVNSDVWWALWNFYFA